MRWARPLLGTIVEITAEGPGAALSGAIEAAFVSIEQVQRLMSFHEANSDVSRINNAQVGQEVRIDSHTFRVLHFARQLSEFSAGLFDVTTAPVLVANGFLPKPDKEAIPFGASYRDLLLLSNSRVLWRRKGWIDLGGVAKGYAVDCAILTLRSQGVRTAVVNAGGDLCCFGTPQPIYIRHPEGPETLLCVGLLSDAAIATSAGYFSRVDDGGRQIEPLIDPRRGICRNWRGSISVAASETMTADALTKVVGLAPKTAPDILAHFGAQAVLIDGDGAHYCGPARLHADVAI